MKNIFYLIVLLYILTNSLYATNKNFGIGISLFYPTGITLKYKWDKAMSFESTIGIAEFGGHFHAGILYDFVEIDKNIKLYTGGAFLIEERKRKVRIFRGFFEESNAYYPGIRAPFGVVFYYNNLDIFGEISMNLVSKEGIEGFLGIAIGIRGYL